MSHNKVVFDWLIFGTRNPYKQVQAPDFLKRHFGAKRVGNYYVFVNQSKLYLVIFSDRQK